MTQVVFHPLAAQELMDAANYYFVLPKFPYSLLYRIVDKDLIRVLAIAHHKRQPQYWVDRA